MPKPKKKEPAETSQDQTQSLQDFATRIAKTALQADSGIDVVSKTLEKARTAGLGFQQQRESMTKNLANSDFFKAQQQKFFTSIFPIAGKVLECASELYNSKDINDTQRNQLGRIKQDIVNIPAKMLSG